MKNLMKIITITPVLLALLLAGCSLDAPSDPTGEVNDPGLADAASRYAAIGNSLTAGYMDGGLMMAGQANSYPRLIANQLGLDNTEFSQPWIAAPGIGSSAGSDPSMVAGVLYFNGSSISVLGETPAAEVQGTLLLAVTQPTPYHNLGVPGALLADGLNAFDAASGGGNPFFTFINRAGFFGNNALSATLPGPVTVPYQSCSMTYEAVTKGGALTTMWLGNNDVLGPATGGNPTPGFGPDNAEAFQARYTATLSVLAGGLMQRNGFPATIVVANIPGITSAPYFMPVATFNQAIGGAWPWGFDESNVEYVLFPTLAWAAVAANQGTAIASNRTLTTAEVADIATAVATYNAIISGVAAAVNGSGMAKVGVMDANGALASLSALQKTHLLFLLGAGMDLETAAATTYFSLDGIHPNNVGYGFVANQFIDVINSLDGSSIPPVDLAGLTWDPTYGVTPAAKRAGTGLPAIEADAAQAMAAVFRWL
jgi:lysophospholipase L1-like esterase